MTFAWGRNEHAELESLARIERLLEHLKEVIMADLSALASEVQENRSVIESAIALINNIASQLAQVADNPAEVQALADELNSQSEQLAQAVAANTPGVEGDVPPEEGTPPEEAPA